MLLARAALLVSPVAVLAALEIDLLDVFLEAGWLLRLVELTSAASRSHPCEIVASSATTSAMTVARVL